MSWLFLPGSTKTKSSLCVTATFCLLVIKEHKRACEGGSLGCARQPGATVYGVELENISNKESQLYMCGGLLSCRPPKSLFPSGEFTDLSRTTPPWYHGWWTYLPWEQSGDMSIATSLVCCGNLGKSWMILSASVSNVCPEGPTRSSVLSIRIRDPRLLELWGNTNNE